MGVTLSYHKRDEYLKLTAEQKQELYVWRESSANSNTNRKKPKDDKSTKCPTYTRETSESDKQMKRIISSAIA